MFKSNTKLKKVSDSIFQETEVIKGCSIPLEWSRRFNDVILPLKNIEIITHVNTHYTDFDIKREFEDNPEKLIKPNIRTSISIKAIVDKDQVNDTIYSAELDGNNDDIFTLQYPRGDTKVELISSKPIKDSEIFHDGVFGGNCFRIDDDIILALRIPEEQLKTIASNLQSDFSPTINLSVALLSFNIEEDAFSPYDDSRDIFIQGNTYAFVSHVGLTSKVGTQTVKKSEDNEEEEYQYDVTDDQKELSLEQLQKPLNSIMLAIWTLVFLLVVSMFFK